ncbi:MAG TPA: tripartite tricarboxylate transporter permease, partial [Burkholderiaceae bacterium]
AYMSSMLGGVFGALLMAVTLPLIRPFVLHIGSPELLAFSVFGISMVARLSGKSPLRGLTAAGLGIVAAMVGADQQTGTIRWGLGSLYLWEGLPLIPVVLGVFALPELADLLIARTQIASGKSTQSVRFGMLQGAKDCFTHWWLVVRCSWLGAVFGTVPGMGGAVIDWLAYGHALKTEKGARETFGKGDVRGVIASESANNAREGGALIPTVAFGVPGSAGMAILLGAFLMHGLVPGPEMLTKNLSFTYSMVWSIAIANILGAGLCYLMSGQFARLATLRYSLILPSVLPILLIGAFESNRAWGDLYVTLLFGVLGWIMKQLKWPRPPLILGFVLGEIIERYMFISIERYGMGWMTRPLVLAVFALVLWTLLQPVYKRLRERTKRRGGVVVVGVSANAGTNEGAYIHADADARPDANVNASGSVHTLSDASLNPGINAAPAQAALGPRRFSFRAVNLFPLGVVLLLAFMLWEGREWPVPAKIIPMIVGSIAIACAFAALVGDTFRRVPLAGQAAAVEADMHMDLASDLGDIPVKIIVRRVVFFFGWLLAFLGGMATIGLIPTLPVFVVAFMRAEARERWSIVVPQAVILTLFVYVVFDQIFSIPWPPTVLGGLFPGLKAWVPSL